MTKFEILLNEKGKTLQELSKAMGQSSINRNLYQLKNGELYFSECEYSTLRFISKFLGVSQEELLEDEDVNDTITNIKYLTNIKKRLEKKLDKIDTDTYAGTISKRSNYYLVWSLENIDNGTNTLIFVIPDKDSYETYLAEFTVDGSYRDCSFYKYASSTPLFDEQEEVSVVSELKDGFNQIKEQIDNDSGEEIDYLQFMDVVGPIIFRMK